MFASAWPRVSWKCTASFAGSVACITMLTMRCASSGVPTPIVSPREIS
jgi:hypothetical protein